MTSRFLIYSGLLVILFTGAGCGDRFANIGQAPTMSGIDGTREAQAMATTPLARDLSTRRASDGASLWTAGRASLLGDHRAQQSGDILTVVVEINNKAALTATSSRGRTGSENMSISALLGLDQIGPFDPNGDLTLTPGVSTSSTSASSGDGTTSGTDKLTLRVAATVVGMLPNGVLEIQGTQEIRVNFELRELIVTGYVRPEDISRQNEIPYDKIASARISYGGRGQITDMQQPRWGQQLTDIILPY